MEEIVCTLLTVTDVDTENNQSLASTLLREALQVGDFGQTTYASSAPEVEYDCLASLVGELNPPS